MDNNLYFVIDESAREFVVIDPTLASEPALKEAQKMAQNGYTCQAIWNTHGHFDHVYGNAAWKAALNVPIYAHPADRFFLDHLREQAIWFGFEPPAAVAPDFEIDPEQTWLQVGAVHPRILHVPGHSPGSVAFYFEQDGVLIAGDVLFAGSIGRTDLPAASEAELADSVRLLWNLPPETRVLPGHMNETTIGQEMKTNAVARQLLAKHPA